VLEEEVVTQAALLLVVPLPKSVEHKVVLRHLVQYQRPVVVEVLDILILTLLFNHNNLVDLEVEELIYQLLVKVVQQQTIQDQLSKVFLVEMVDLLLLTMQVVVVALALLEMLVDLELLLLLVETVCR